MISLRSNAIIITPPAHDAATAVLAVTHTLRRRNVEHHAVVSSITINHHTVALREHTPPLQQSRTRLFTLLEASTHMAPTAIVKSENGEELGSNAAVPDGVRSQLGIPPVPDDVASAATIVSVPVATEETRILAVPKEEQTATASEARAVPLVKQEAGTPAVPPTIHDINIEDVAGGLVPVVKEENLNTSEAHGVPAVKPENVMSAGDSPAPDRRTRKRRDELYQGEPQRKRQRTEFDFHLEKMEYYFKEAREYAEEGNRSLMDYGLKEAKEHSRKAGILNTDFLNREAKIRSSLGNEHAFHLARMEYYLKEAREYAEEGNHSLMDYGLKEAKEHARKAGILNTDFLNREAKIRSSLGNEHAFHLARMEYYLKEAREYAEEGNRSLMDYGLKEAKEHARKAGILNTDFLNREAKIRSSLGNEHAFHLARMEYYLKEAREYAEEGNLSLMDYGLKEAKEHARKAETFKVHSRKVETFNSYFRAREEEIRGLLCGCVVKIEES